MRVTNSTVETIIKSVTVEFNAADIEHIKRAGELIYIKRAGELICGPYKRSLDNSGNQTYDLLMSSADKELLRNIRDLIRKLNSAIQRT